MIKIKYNDYLDEINVAELINNSKRRKIVLITTVKTKYGFLSGLIGFNKLNIYKIKQPNIFIKLIRKINKLFS